MNSKNFFSVFLLAAIFLSAPLAAAVPDGYQSEYLTLDAGVTLDGTLMITAQTKAHALASGDFDHDGIADLAVKYTDASGDFIALYRGNPDSIYPYSKAAWERRKAGDYHSSPFHRSPVIYRDQAVFELLATGFVFENNDGLLGMRLNADAQMDYVMIPVSGGEPTVLASLVLATIVVTSNADNTIANDGECTLREAIINANDGGDATQGDCVAGTASGADAINFSIGTTNSRTTIVMTDGLPEITDPVSINGNSQCATPPCVELDGAAVTLPIDVTDLNAITISGGSSVISGLVITGWPDEGIEMIGTVGGNLVEGIYGGIGFDGETADGVAGAAVQALSPNNIIGGTTAAARNILSGNGLSGVAIFNLNPESGISDASNNSVIGNYIGTNADGDSIVGNGAAGVFVSEANDNSIGGTAVGEGNLISGNVTGVSVFEFGIPSLTSAGTTIQGNLIGTDKTGTLALGNSSDGIYIRDASGITVGGTSAAARNIISGNGNTLNAERHGVLIYTTDTFNGPTENNRIRGNYIGTDITGTIDMGNGSSGVSVTNSSNNTVGGTEAGAGNVISGNAWVGVFVGLFAGGTTASGNAIEGNLIGTNSAGTTALGNSSTGIYLGPGSDNTLIGGTVSAGRNVISGNFRGIHIQTSLNNTVQANYIGTDQSGMQAIPNLEIGIVVSDVATGNMIGGPGAGPANMGLPPGNLISGNTDIGIGFYSDSANNTVQGNWVGSNILGTSAVPNGNVGIATFSSGAQAIGGLSSGEGNLVSGNAGSGILLQGPSTGNTVLNNYVGVSADGNSALANAEGVTVVGSSANLIGKPGMGNLIAYHVNGVLLRDAGSDDNQIVANVIRDNSNDGIVTLPGSGTGNLFSQNSIFDNGNFGIDLEADGLLVPNDDKDPDTGSNNLQNYPILTAASSGSTVITGTLNSLPNTGFTIEYFSVEICDPSSFGEGQVYLGKQQVTTDVNGNADVSTSLTSNTPGGHSVTATASDSDGNTSEFSQCVVMMVSDTIFEDSFE